MQLAKLRRKIDAIDQRLIGLLNERAGLSVLVNNIKRRSGQAVYSPDREQDVLKKVSLANKGPLSSAAVEAVYREIMSGSLSLNKPLKIAYLGPQATFTHMAALKRFGSQVEYLSCKDIADVFLAVERDDADYGVVPIENSVEGMVNHTLDMFMDSDLKIYAQIVLDVAHNFLSNSCLSKIRQVYSNPQVFGQCRRWLRENLPCAEEIEVSSTTRAAQIACRTKNSGCIASLLAAKTYGLKVIAANIEDSPHNITRFLVIGKTEAVPSGCDRSAIMFSIKDKVGALHDMLVPFKRHRINLTKIESRPSKKKAWDYYFFVDMEGHISEPKVRQALKELGAKCRFLKVLGSYPVAE
jgi:chorismate mutase/prephenate dehydratase